jgi:L-2,4-diaminobutyrate decarboxylase
MSKPELKIPSPYNPEKFRKEGHTLVDTLSDYLNNALSGEKMAVLPWNEPDRLAEYFAFDSKG